MSKATAGAAKEVEERVAALAAVREAGIEEVVVSTEVVMAEAMVAALAEGGRVEEWAEEMVAEEIRGAVPAVAGKVGRTDAQMAGAKTAEGVVVFRTRRRFPA